MATTTLAFNSTLRPAETGYHDMALVHACKHGSAAAFEERHSEIIQFPGIHNSLTWLTRITVNESLMNLRKQQFPGRSRTTTQSAVVGTAINFEDGARWEQSSTHLAFKHEKKPASIGAAPRVFGAEVLCLG